MTDLLVISGQALFICVALCTIAFDLRLMRIPDALSLVLVALFIAICAYDMPPDIWARLGLSAAVFAASFVAFARRMMGGGDVKIMTVLALFVPVHGLAHTALIFSATLLISTVLIILARRVLPQRQAWAFLGTKRMPMGVPIGLAALCAPLVIG